MYARQLRQALGNHPETEHIFEGVFSCDSLPTRPRGERPSAMISNLAASGEPGTHWVAFFFNSKPPHEYFDSYGLPVAHDVYRDMLASDNGHLYVRNCNILQSPFSTVCGQYCMHFILMRSRGYTMEEIVNEFSSYDLTSNDRRVNNFARRNFGVKMDIYDSSFLLPRINSLLTNIALLT